MSLTLSKGDPIKCTVSLCPECYMHIPAMLEDRAGEVWMTKTCPTHGDSEALVDPSRKYWDACTMLRGELVQSSQVCLIDCTGRCNTTCPHCYYDLAAKNPDPTVEAVVSEAVVLRRHYAIERVLLTGGEPTVRDDLPEILAKIGEAGISAELATNGVRLADRAYLDEILRTVSRREKGHHCIYFSVHPKEGREHDWDAKQEALENLKAAGATVLVLMWTIEHDHQVKESLLEAMRHRGLAAQYRLRTLFNYWRTREFSRQRYPSELYGLVAQTAEEECEELQIDYHADNAHSRANLWYGGERLRLCCCLGADAIDLEQYAYGPYYRARTGRVDNFMTALLLNEGMDKGWISGRKLYARG
jgi:uncharacterized radical SAM superfamily Fe-S cluster-containing enzyme